MKTDIHSIGSKGYKGSIWPLRVDKENAEKILRGLGIEIVSYCVQTRMFECLVSKTSFDKLQSERNENRIGWALSLA